MVVGTGEQDSKPTGLPSHIGWKDGKLVDLNSGEILDPTLARHAAKVGKWNRAAVEDRRRQVWDLLLRNVPETMIAKIFSVHRNTIVSDVRAVRNANRERVRRGDQYGEAGEIVKRFEDMIVRAFEEFQLADTDGKKVAFFGHALKAMTSKAEFLVKTGLVPVAKLSIDGEIRLSDGLDVSKMSLEEMKATRNQIVRRIVTEGSVDPAIGTGTN